MGVRILRGLFRTLKLCLEGRIGRKLPINHPMTSWLLEHTSLLLNACIRGEDGSTAWARVRGRAFGQRLIGFGESILWKQPLKGPQHDVEGNMGPRLLPGIFLGYRRDANTYVVGLENGEMVESRAVTRRPMDDRWKGELVESITDTPWTTRTRAPAVRVELGDAVDAHPAHPVQPSLPRRLKITMKMLRQHGTTDGCTQCEHIRAFSEHKAGVQHSEKCRKRIAESLAATEDGADRLARSELRINRGIEAASRPDEPRGGEVMDQALGPMADQAVEAAAERPHVVFENMPEAAGPHPRDAGIGFGYAQASSDPVADADEDMAFMGSIMHDDDMMSMMMNLGAADKHHKREGRAARRRMVSEIYSPPRVTRAISSMPSLRLVPGFALDLTCIDPDDGQPWDFDLESKQVKAMELVRT